MEITISVAGRFHAFYLAQQLLKKNYLQRLITSYPKFEVKKYGIPKKLVRSVIIKELLFRGWSHMPRFLRRAFDPTYLIGEIFDVIASTKIPKTDIFIGWSNKSLHSLRKAKEMGAMTILERGSSHVLFQSRLLNEEYEKWGAASHRVHPKTMEKELIEYRETDYIEVPSSFVKRTFIENGIPERKIIQGRRGVDLSQFKKVPKNDGVFRVIFAGGMSLRKGVHYLLEAFSGLNLKNSELLLMGTLDDEMKPFFKKYEGKFKWIGHIPQSELYKYYSQGSVFVMPSLEEGFAVVQLQAMACGLPLICTTNSGGEDVVEEGKNGFVIPIRNVDKLREKIMFFHDNPELCLEMGNQARKKSESGFTWEDYGDIIIPQYERLWNDFKNKKTN